MMGVNAAGRFLATAVLVHQRLTACASTCFRLHYYYYLLTQPERNPTPPFSSRCCFIRQSHVAGGEALLCSEAVCGSAESTDSAPPDPDSTAATSHRVNITPRTARHGQICPRLIITHTHTSGHTESVSSIKNEINQANTYCDDNTCNTYF